ncbi:hypothetical protein [Paenarthrobacter sp. YJN-5]|uniref:hypothetical protein n=1 Tax=Paenarthrobacter sp. YJN-5 TaxID=2735316 RepID=UPI0018775D5C|nr:hypothetical protein [Paenarthrobacter sp. YJN-5]QOT19206.1 hypothetical protein HMI59_23250 [Paenarthrobacter sp. YJN-5]
MSEKNLKERVLDQSAKDKQAIEDWMFGPGGKILGAIIVILGIWTIVRFIWS